MISSIDRLLDYWLAPEGAGSPVAAAATLRIAYLGLAVIGYVSVSMIWRGSNELAQVVGI